MLVLLLVGALGTAPSDLAAPGVVIHPEAARCSAILTSGGRSRIVSVGDAAFGGRVVAIHSSSVDLTFEDGPVTLRLSGGDPKDRPLAATPTATPPAIGPTEDPATPHRMMSRAEVERRLGSEIPRILADTALAPDIEDGQVVGLAVTRLAEGTLLSDAGLRQGDVITEVNGTPIDSMATLIGLWPRLQGATDLQAIVRRAGRPVSLAVTFR
jgi:general secretion pathway protein C